MFPPGSATSRPPTSKKGQLVYMTKQFLTGWVIPTPITRPPMTTVAPLNRTASGRASTSDGQTTNKPPAVRR